MAPEAVAGEVARLDRAIETSVADLEAQHQAVKERLGHEVADIFNWHIGVLKDEWLRSRIMELIERDRYSAAYAVSTVMRKQQQRFKQMPDPLLAERVRDVQDIERRLLRNIFGEAAEDLVHLQRDVILVAHDLSTSQTAQLAETKVAGVALDVGGATSHTAILLRSLGRPAVVALKHLSGYVSGGDILIVDGVNHMVIADPNEETLAKYEDQRAQYIRLVDELGHLRDPPAVTQDGVRVELMANIAGFEVYFSRDVAEWPPVSFEFEQTDYETVLRALLDGPGLSYRVTGDDTLLVSRM